jgi:hypothetical protein
MFRIAVAAWALMTGVAGAQGVVIERTLAIVAGQIITLSDVTTLRELGLIEVGAAEDPVAAGARRLIERALILREVERYAPGAPAEAEVDARLAAIRDRYESALDLARVLEAGGFTTARLRAWVRDDLRIASYLAQRFPAAGLPTDQEIGAYFAERREEYERDEVPFEQILPIVRERLVAERRQALIADWVEGLRRRAEVVELYPP